MSRKHSFFLAAILFFGAALALAQPRQVILTPADLGAASAQHLWAWNLGSEPVDITIESTTAGVRVETGEAVEVSELLRDRGPVVVPEGAAVLMMATSRDFDPNALAVDDEARVQLEKGGERTRVRVLRPTWAKGLVNT